MFLSAAFVRTILGQVMTAYKANEKRSKIIYLGYGFRGVAGGWGVGGGGGGGGDARM